MSKLKEQAREIDVGIAFLENKLKHPAHLGYGDLTAKANAVGTINSIKDEIVNAQFVADQLLKNERDSVQCEESQDVLKEWQFLNDVRSDMAAIEMYLENVIDYRRYPNTSSCGDGSDFNSSLSKTVIHTDALMNDLSGQLERHCLIDRESPNFTEVTNTTPDTYVLPRAWFLNMEKNDKTGRRESLDSTIQNGRRYVLRSLYPGNVPAHVEVASAKQGANKTNGAEDGFTPKPARFTKFRGTAGLVSPQDPGFSSTKWKLPKNILK